MVRPAFRLNSVFRPSLIIPRRHNSTASPRHLLSIADLSHTELTALVSRAQTLKNAFKARSAPESLTTSLRGQTVAMTFSKRSTRTRVSTEGAVAALGGHPMFLGKEDIQLGVNESLRDTAIVLSSMSSCLVARVGPHADVAGLAEHSTVPVINALSDLYHPLQTVADFLTILENFGKASSSSLGLEGLKIAWVGDANNVLFDMAIGALKLGADISVATPDGYQIPNEMRSIITEAADSASSGKLQEFSKPEDALKGANIVVTDTWVSMGQEQEAKKRLAAFKGFQVTSELITRGQASPDWKFMHCLPRHAEEVSDEVFYGPNSLVFPEAENRLWAAVAVLEAFVVNKGKISA